MNRLSYDICKLYYETLGIQFKEEYNSEEKRWYGNNAQYAVVCGDDRFPLIVGGERSGKSFVSAAILLPHVELLPILKPNRNKRERDLNPDFVIFGPSYAEPRIEFQYLENWLLELGDIKYSSKPRDGAWTLVTKSNVVVSTWSTDNPASIRAVDLEGAIAAECGNMEEDAIQRIQGRIGAKRGFCIYSGTMENAKRWYVKWALEGERLNRFRIKTYSIPTWANRHEFPGGEQDDEIKRWKDFYPEDIFMTRVAAKPVPPRDRVIREITPAHLRKVSLPRNDDGTLACDIELAIDPGYLPSAYAVLWLAKWKTDTGMFFYFFDEFYEQEVQNEDMIERIKRHRFYKYLQVDGLTIDISAKRHADGNEPCIEKYKKLTKIKSPYVHYWHERALIDRIRTTAKANNIAIHPNCRGLIAELGLGEEIIPTMHPWRFPTAKDGIITNEKPTDEWNHSCKAMGYVLLRHLHLVERMGERSPNRNRIRDGLPKGVKRHSVFASRRT